LIGLAILSALVLIWVVLRMTRGEDPEPEPVRKRPKSQTSQNLNAESGRKSSVGLSAHTKEDKFAKKEELNLKDGESDEPRFSATEKPEIETTEEKTRC
jgi:hypothetical protein